MTQKTVPIERFLGSRTDHRPDPEWQGLALMQLSLSGGEAVTSSSRATIVLGLFLVACGLALAGCSLGRTGSADRAAIDRSKVVDMTYAFDDTTIYWPTAKPFEWQKESWGTPSGYWYAAARYAASEHGGTHIDGPIHFGQGKLTIDQIPVSRLIGPAVVIEVADQCEKDRDYRLSVPDIVSWEKKHGAIPQEAIVLVHTGWGKFWPDKKRYWGSDVPGDASQLHFPGFSREAAEFLVTKRKINGVGIDTASLDHGPSSDFIAHRTFNGAEVYGLENVANLERLPSTGATLIALPMKIKGGTGAPTRIIAILP